jgi:hypothetical protein
MIKALALTALWALTACTAVAEDREPARRRPPGTCDAQPAQRFVGQKATAQAAVAIVGATGASTLRWLAPNSVVTMEYAFGRVNVAYDDQMTITRVTCG